MTTTPGPDLTRFRLTTLLGGVLISLFMISDLKLLPEQLDSIYAFNRFGLQLPVVFSMLAISFHPVFRRVYQPLIVLGLLALTYSNYWLILQCWDLMQFAFPYEGTVLYAFFGFFIFGIGYRLALIYCLLSAAGFAALLISHPIYAERTHINLGFVVASMLIGVIGRYQLDQLIDRIHRTNQELTRLSVTDPLTGLYNRRALMEEAGRLLDHSDRATQPVTVYMLDIDHFKAYNDHYGHQQGDRAIQVQAAVLQEVFKRDSDVLGRYGGEEFLVVTAGGTAEQSIARAEEIQTALQAVAIPHGKGGAAATLTCSVGISYKPGPLRASLESLIQRADKALYLSKERGRDTYTLSQEDY